MVAKQVSNCSVQYLGQRSILRRPSTRLDHVLFTSVTLLVNEQISHEHDLSCILNEKYLEDGDQSSLLETAIGYNVRARNCQIGRHAQRGVEKGFFGSKLGIRTIFVNEIARVLYCQTWLLTTCYIRHTFTSLNTE